MKIHRNALFLAIRDIGLNPEDFQFKTPSYFQNQLVHKPTKSYFLWLTSDDEIFSGSRQIGDSIRLTYRAREWNELINEDFRSWLNLVKDEQEAPDYWGNFIKTGIHINETEKEGPINSLFTPAETSQISAQLKEIKNFIHEQSSLTTQQITHLDEQLSDMEEASHRLGRKDWYLLFYGAFFSLLISSIVPPDVVQHSLIIFSNGLRHLFEGPPPQLPPQAQ